MIRIGTVIKIRTTDNETNEKINEKWIVKKIYPHMVYCENKIGRKKYFSYGDLIVMKIIKQSPELEALKDSVNMEHRFAGKYIKQ